LRNEENKNGFICFEFCIGLSYDAMGVIYSWCRVARPFT